MEMENTAGQNNVLAKVLYICAYAFVSFLLIPQCSVDALNMDHRLAKNMALNKKDRAHFLIIWWFPLICPVSFSRIFRSCVYVSIFCQLWAMTRSYSIRLSLCGYSHLCLQHSNLEVPSLHPTHMPLIVETSGINASLLFHLTLKVSPSYWITVIVKVTTVQ